MKESIEWILDSDPEGGLAAVSSTWMTKTLEGTIAFLIGRCTVLTRLFFFSVSLKITSMASRPNFLLNHFKVSHTCWSLWGETSRSLSVLRRVRTSDSFQGIDVKPRRLSSSSAHPNGTKSSVT